MKLILWQNAATVPLDMSVLWAGEMWIGPSMNCLNMITILIFLLACTSNQPTIFKTGKDLQAALAASIKWSSIGVELDSQLEELQSQSEVAILRDRRLDPHRLIQVETDFVPRVQVLKRISDTIPDSAVCVTESFALLGPAMAVDRLPVLLARNAEQLNSLQMKIAPGTLRRLTTKINLSWDDLAEPRQMLADQATSVGAVILNPNEIPHDVWAARRLPKMSFVELATVVLNQFDLTIKVSDNAAEFTVVPIDPDESFEHRYVVGKFKPKVSYIWQNQFPDADVKWSGSNATITTTLQSHARLNAILQQAMYPAASDSTTSSGHDSLRTTNYQLKAEGATLGQLIEYFRRENVTVEVIDESADEVQAVLKESISLSNVSQKLTGAKFFPLIFGKHFKRVDVKDDRVVLSLN